MSQFLCPDVIQGCGIRLTDLDQWGIPADPLTAMSRVFTSGFIELTVDPVVFQNAPIPVGGDTEGEACIIDNDTPKLTKFNFTLRLCGVPAPVFEKMIGATLLEDPNTANLFRGMVLKDGHAECCADTLMLEIFSKSSDGCETGDCPFTQWIFPLTRNWQLTGSFTYQNGETEFVLTGTGEANPNFFPSMPGPTLPSYTTAGVPEGPTPPLLPINPATTVEYVADTLVQNDVDEIRAHGPLAMFCIPALPDGIDDCGYLASDAAVIVPPVAVPDADSCEADIGPTATPDAFSCEVE